MMKHATLNTICNTIDCAMGVGLPGGAGTKVALRVDDVLSPEPLVRKNGTLEFRAYPWGNPALRENLGKFRSWNPQLADTVAAVLNVRSDENLKGVRKLLDACKNESPVCRLALAKCCLKGRDGTIDRGRALALLSKEGRNDSVNDMERACRKTVFSADDLLNEIGVYHYGTGKSETAQKFFKRAMELAPECGNYVHNYCVALVTLGWYSTAFPYLCERCEQGDEELYYNLGYAYYYYHLHGHGPLYKPLPDSEPRTAEDVAKAAKWLSKSHDKRCYPLLSKIYFNHYRYKDKEGNIQKRGHGLFDAGEAFKVCMQGAESSDCYSMACVGLFYGLGYGCGSNRDESVKWLGKSVDKCGREKHGLYKDTLFLLAVGGMRNQAEWMRYLEKYTKEFPDSVPFADYKLAMAYYADQRYTAASGLFASALGKLKKSSHKGLLQKLMPAIWSYAGMSAYFAERWDDARTLLDEAVRQEGDAAAAYFIGRMYKDRLVGASLSKDEANDKAIYYFVTSAEMGDKDAPRMAFERLFYKDYYKYAEERNKTVDYAFLAASTGYAPAQFYLYAHFCTVSESYYNKEYRKENFSIQVGGKLRTFSTNPEHYLALSREAGYKEARYVCALYYKRPLEEVTRTLNEMMTDYGYDEVIGSHRSRKLVILNAAKAHYLLAYQLAQRGGERNLMMGVNCMRMYLDREENRTRLTYKDSSGKEQVYVYPKDPSRAAVGLKWMLETLENAGKKDEAAKDVRHYYELKGREGISEEWLEKAAPGLKGLVWRTEHPKASKMLNKIFGD